MTVDDTTDAWYQHSDYLSSIARNYSQLLSDSLISFPSNQESSKDNSDKLQQLITQVSQLQIEDVEKAKQELRVLKAQFDWHWSYHRLQDNQQSQNISAKILGKLRTEFADVTINKALEIAWQYGKVNGLIKHSAKDKPTGLFIFGMGKLGGYDLNFSSDIDLIAFYEPVVFPVTPISGYADVASKLLKQCTQILSQTIENQFVWRVDWRLRPDASVASLAMSMDSGINFYRFRSLP